MKAHAKARRSDASRQCSAPTAFIVMVCEDIEAMAPMPQAGCGSVDRNQPCRAKDFDSGRLMPD